MYYKDTKSTNPNEKTRALRRLWLVEIYEGDPDAKNPKTRIETVIAWNAVDAIRRCGSMKVATPPIADCYVTWDDQPLKIESPQEGPTEEEIKPTIAPVDEEDW